MSAGRKHHGQSDQPAAPDQAVPLPVDHPSAAGFRSGFVALVGPANAGKSTLLNALVGAKVSIVSSKEQTTRTRIRGIKTTKDAQLIFLDTPGFFAKRYRGELSRYINRELSEAAGEGDVVLLVLDAVSLRDDRSAAHRLLTSLRERRIRMPRVIAVNKVDLLQREQLLPLLQRLMQELGEPIEAASGERVELVPISARRGEGIEQLAELLSRLLPEGPPYFPIDEISDQPEELLCAEIIREKLFQRLHQEIPYSLAVQIERWQEEESLLRLGAVIFVERDSQKGIVIGEGGHVLKEAGRAARRELEEIFGVQVHLELFVRVEPNWTRTSRGLKKAGIGGPV